MAEKPSYLERPWRKQAERRGLPPTLEPYPVIPLFQFLDDSIRDFPRRPALTFLDRQMTYAELGREVDSLAAALAGLGVKKGDRVGTILVNSPQFLIADYAILKAGAAHVPCSPLHTAADLEHELGAAGVETLFCMDSSLDLVRKVREKVKLQNLIVTGLEDYLKPLPAESPAGDAISFRKLIAGSEPRPPRVSIDPREDLAEVPFTGGATGLPKGVMLTHYNLTTNVKQTWGLLGRTELGSYLLKGNCAVLLGLPFFHQYGHYAMHAAVSMAWNMLLVPNPRDTDLILDLMKKHRPLMNVGVPTQYMRLAAEKRGRLGVIGVSGSAALPADVADKYEEATGAPVDEGYGLTETSPVTHANMTGLLRLLPPREDQEPIEIPPAVISAFKGLVRLVGPARFMRGMTYLFPLLVRAANRREKKGGTSVRKKGSIGVPVLDTDCKLVDLHGQEVPFGEPGEMWIRGPQVMKGYWPEPGAGLKDGWLPTGDIARMDEDGYFYIVDRIKDMINISGNKVYSRVVDDVLYQHPAVRMAAAIGLPDPERPGSERVKVFLSIAPGRDPEKVREEVLKLCREQLPPYAVPKAVEFRDEFPLTVTEKIFKRKLREQEIEKMRAEGLLPPAG